MVIGPILSTLPEQFPQQCDGCYHSPFMAQYSIGVDLGGTNLRAAAVTRDGKILQRIAVTANPMLGRGSLLGEMTAVINDARAAWRTEQLVGIGLGVPGFILLKEGVIRNSNNLACLEDFPF